MESADARVLRAVRRLYARDGRPTTIEAIMSFTGLDRDITLDSITRLSQEGALCERAELTRGRRVCVYQPPGRDAEPLGGRGAPGPGSPG